MIMRFPLNAAVVSNGNHCVVPDRRSVTVLKVPMEKVSMRRVFFAAGLGEFHHHQRSL